MKLSTINKVLSYILLFFGLFDCARNYTPLPIAFGYLKDICIYAIFIINIKKIKLSPVLGYGGMLWMILVLFFSPVGFIYAKVEPSEIAISWFKYLEFFLLMLIFYNFRDIFRSDIDHYVQAYIKGGLLLCFVNVFGYFVDNPIVSAKRPNENIGVYQWQGRISVGQPAVAVIPLIISSLWLLICGKRPKDKVYAIIYIICIFLANSNTGIASLAGCIVIIIVYELFLKSGKTVSFKKLVYAISTCILLALVIFTIINALSDVIMPTLNLYFERFNSFFMGSDAGMSLRIGRKYDAFKEFNLYQFITGMGIYGFTSKMGNVIENSYLRYTLEYGILGLISIIMFFGQFIVKSGSTLLCKKSSNTKNSLFLLCITIVFMLHMYTLDLFTVYTLYYSAALFLNYCYLQDGTEISRSKTFGNVSS